MAMRFIACICCIGIGPLITSGALGQAYPSKPVRILTATAGGNNDILGRFIAQGITGPLGQPVIVENRPGTTATDTVAKAAPDGYMLLIMGPPVWIAPLLQKTAYDPVRDLAPITLVASSPNVLVVHPSLPVKSTGELIALAKARPGQLNYASGTTGSSTFLAGALFKSLAGVDIVGVPYQGAAPAINALLAGEVQLTFDAVPTVMPHVKSGRLRALAATSSQPSVLAPGLPTVAASGLPGYEAMALFGMWAPGNAPQPVIDVLNREIVRAIRAPEMHERFLSSGAEPVGNSSSEFGAKIKSEMAKWSKVIKDAGIHVDR